MKNIKFIFSLLLVQIAFLSNADAQNWLTAGNVVNSGQFLGSTNFAPLQLRSNNNEVARFTTSRGSAIGHSNAVSALAPGSIAAGHSNFVLHSSVGSLALGHSNTVDADKAFALGADNTVDQPFSGCVGTNLRATADHALTIGIGAYPNNQLTNTTPNSIVLGVYAPTVLVTETLVSIGNIAPDPFYTLTVSGDVIANGEWLISDRRYKKEIRTLDNALDRVLSLRGTEYFLRADEFKEKKFSSEKQIGLIAQELKEVFPELVRENTDGHLSVNYVGVIPVLVEAMKEQQMQIAEKDAAISCLQTQMESLETRLARLEASLNQTASDARAFEQPKLEKAFGISPNPSNGQFQLTRSETAQNEAATMLVFDGNGREVARRVMAAGSRSADFNLNLPNGTYNVSLLSNGKLSATQTLVVTK